jgi:hypothetical protein
MKRFTIFLILLLALSAAADYTTNVTVVETVDSPAETPTATETANITVIEITPTETLTEANITVVEETTQPAVESTPTTEATPTPVPTEVSTESPTSVPTEVPVEKIVAAETPAPTEAQFGPEETPTPEEQELLNDVFTEETLSDEVAVPFGPGATSEPTNIPTETPTLQNNLTEVFTQETLAVNETPVPTDVPTEVPTSVPTETPTENATNTTLVDAVITDSNGDVVPAVVAVLDNQNGQTIDQAVQTDSNQEQLNVTESVVDAYVAPLKGPIQDMLFDNVEIVDESSLDLKLDIEIPDGQGPEGIDIARAYAIDPTAMEFDEALVTAIAEGNSLYKCKAWNFDERRCDGSWELIRTDLTPGTEYEFILTAADPAFAEGIRTALRLYATDGPDPNVTAVVTDGVGIGVPGVLVDFTASAGVMTPASGVTGADGTITSVQTGGALNNTIVANSTGLTPVNITSAAASAIAAASRGIIWFDNSTQQIKTAVINPFTGVLNSGTITPAYSAASGSLLNPASFSVGAATSQVTPLVAFAQVWHNTYMVGDSIEINIPTTNPNPDFIFVMPGPPSYHLFAYSIAGANPTVTAVVMDANGTGLPNVMVNFTSSAGVMTPSTGVTGVNGTISSTQSGGAIGDTINVTANVSGTYLQLKQVQTAAASPAIVASSRVIAWLDNTTNLIGVAVVDTTSAARNVLSATGAVSSTNLDRTPFNDVVLSTGTAVDQLAPAYGSVRIAPFTYGGNDVVIVNLGTTTPVNDQTITLTKYNRTFLEVFAISGSNPNITAVVTDENGIAVANATINFSASAGALSITSGVTNPDGTLTTIQTGGALGDTINVTYDNQQQTVTTAVSAGIAADDIVFNWYDRVNRTWHVAAVTFTNRVLTSASAVTVTPIDKTPTNAGTIFTSATVAQTGTRESLTRVAQGTSALGDMLSAALGTTTYTTDAFAILPADADRYLYAFSTGAANPNVTAVVTDTFGNGIAGVNVSFVSSAGTMSVSSALTNASGMANASQAGGALGNTINVSSENISSVTIVTATSVAIAAADYVYAWYDQFANRSFSAAVTRATNVLTSGTTTTFVPIDNTPNNNVTLFINGTAQQNTVNMSRANVSAFDNGDIITISVLTTTPEMDAILIINDTTVTRTNNRTRLSAYATSGANPNVTAVITDAFGYGVPNITVNFSASAGVMTPATAVTGPDGTATSVQTGGALGNRINITSFNVSQINITTSPAVAVAANSTTISWYDENQTIFMAAVISPNNTLVSGTVTPAFVLFDETPLNGVTFSTGSTRSQVAPNISITPAWRRTFGAGDTVLVQTATTAMSPENIIIMKNDTRNQLFAYATDGASPNITAVVTDLNGVGVPNVTVNFTTVGGSIPASGITGHDGTVTVIQTGSVGDNITVFTNFQNLTVTTAATPAVAGSSRAIVWIDNTTNIVRTATVSTVESSQNVLSATGVLTITNTDNTPTNNVTFSSGSIVNQASPNVGTTRVAQGTYGTNDILSVGVATTGPALDGAVMMTFNNKTFLDAFATSGANPVVFAYVHDVYGMPIEGVVVNFSSSAGVMTPSSNTTDYSGIATSSQSGGVVGNVINVTIDSQEPVRIITAVSVAIAAADKTFAIYDPRSYTTQVATVTNANNVLTSTSAVTPTAFDAVFGPGVINESTVAAQTTTIAASFRVVPNTAALADMLSITVATTTPAIDAFLTLPLPYGRYLYAFANGGANPNVTAVVTDENGVAVFGVPITFTASAGALSTTLNTTNTSGMATATQSGGALGDTIVVTSPGITNVTIITAASAAIAAADLIIPWFDPEFALVRSAVVTRANNVLVSAATQEFELTDNTPFNNATAANRTTLAQNANRPGQQLLNASSIADNDFVIIATVTASPGIDGLVFVNMSTSVSPNLTVEKNDTPDPVNPGGQIVYTLTFNNTGNGTALDIIINESYPPGVAFHSVSPAGINTSNRTFVLSGVSPNTSTTVNITVNVSSAVPSGTVLNNTVNVTYSNSSGGMFFLNASANTTVIASPSLITNKTASSNPVTNRATFNYSILINNTGASAAFNVTVIETYPENVSFISSIPAPTIGNNTFVIGTIAAGGFARVNITLNVSSPNGSILFNFYVVNFTNASGSIFNVTNSTNTTVIFLPIISVTKVGTPNPVFNGSSLSYVITIENNGDDTAYNATLNDTYPPNVSFFSSSPAPTSGNNSFDLGNLTPNLSTTVNITVNVSPAMLTGVLNNTARVFFNLSNGTTRNSSDSEFTNVTTPPPPPPPPSGGSGGGGSSGNSICPTYCRDPKYQNVAICQSQVCQIAREVLPPPASVPFSGVKPKQEALKREDLQEPRVDTIAQKELIPFAREEETNMLKSLLSGISGALDSANAKVRMLSIALILTLLALAGVGGFWVYKEYRKKNGVQ